MNRITSYFRNLFSKKKVLVDLSSLSGLPKAEAILQQLVNEQKIPGLAITVLKGGQMLLQNGYGFANIETKQPINPTNSIFRIASVSKPIAATALAHMVADKLIDLDSSFYSYVPYYPKKRWDFSIRQLASHTAGIRAYRGTEYGLNKPYSIKESIAIFKDDDLVFEPGTDYLYTSYDWVLISLAMQEASGISFEEYVEEKVLQPLGMTRTFAPLSHVEPDAGLNNKNSLHTSKQQSLDLIKEISAFYSKNKLGIRKAIPVNNYFKLAGGGYLSTATDIAKFGQAYLDKNILNDEVIAPFITAQTINTSSTYYGLGWQVSEDKKGRRFYGHVGNGVGGYSNFFVYPDEELVLVILTNCTNPEIQEDLDEVIDAIMASYQLEV